MHGFVVCNCEKQQILHRNLIVCLEVSHLLFSRHIFTVFYVDDEGTCVSNDLFCVGSGASLALSILDSAGSDSDGKLRYVNDVRYQSGECGISNGFDSNNSLSDEEVMKSTAEEVATSPHTNNHDSKLMKQQTNKLTLHTMPFDQAVDRAVWAVRHATARDGYSGGWINVVVVNSTGVFHVKRIDSAKMVLKI